MTTAQRVNRFLDYPEIFGRRLPHKAFHNPMGVWLVREKYGPKAAKYAFHHLIEDELHHRLKKFLSRNGYKDVVDSATPFFVDPSRNKRLRHFSARNNKVRRFTHRKSFRR